MRLITFNLFDRIGLEAPYAEVEVLNTYLVKGEGDLNDILKSFRQYTYETREFVDLINYIKVYNVTAKKKVLFYGYDFQSPYRALKNIRLTLRQPVAISAANSLITTFSLLTNELYSHQISVDRYKTILNDSEQVFKELNDVVNPQLLRNLNSYRQFLLMNDPEVSRDMGKISEVRDSLMAGNLLNELDQGHRVIVWAHNGHVQKVTNKFSQSMGTHLARSLGRNYGAIRLATYEGFYTAYNNSEQGVVSTNRLVVPKASQIEFHLNQVKYKNFILRTDGLLVPSTINEHRLLGYGVTEDQFQSGSMIDAFDYILFISRTTGSRNYYLKRK